MAKVKIVMGENPGASEVFVDGNKVEKCAGIRLEPTKNGNIKVHFIIIPQVLEIEGVADVIFENPTGVNG